MQLDPIKAAWYIDRDPTAIKHEFMALYHPLMTLAFYYTNTDESGLEVALPNGGGQQLFSYMAFIAKGGGVTDTLDTPLEINFGAGAAKFIKPALAEAEALLTDNQHPILSYYRYSSKDLTTPLEFEQRLLMEVVWDSGAATLTANGRRLDSHRCGEVMDPIRFTPLRTAL
jgi:hypothetical protein